MKTLACPNCSDPMDLEGLVYKCKPCLYLVGQHCPAPKGTFDPSHEHGWSYAYRGSYDKITDAEIHYLITEAERYLPMRCYFEIRALIPQNYGDKEVAWYYHPDMMTHTYLKYAGRVANINFSVAGAYYTLGGFVTGQNRRGFAPEIKAIAAEEDCHCGHSHYDHIGWRAGGKGDNCRIVRCTCPYYYPNCQGCTYCTVTRHQEAI